VRTLVRRLLESSPAFRSLPPDRRRQIDHDTVRVASYVVDPHGMASQEFAHPLLVANDLVQAVDFPAFVGGLIHGVFGAIVNASVQQMEAYGRLMAHASSSVSQFAADDISDARARAELANAFPCWFRLSAKGGLRLADGASPSRSSVARALGLRRPWPSPESASGRQILVIAMRRQVARERQKSLALVLAMGINRIVVTHGHIAAH